MKREVLQSQSPSATEGGLRNPNTAQISAADGRWQECIERQLGFQSEAYRKLMSKLVEQVSEDSDIIRFESSRMPTIEEHADQSAIALTHEDADDNP